MILLLLKGCGLRLATPVSCQQAPDEGVSMQSSGRGTRALRCGTCTSPGSAIRRTWPCSWTLRLRSYTANILWRSYGPTHFGTDLGAFTGAPVHPP